MEQEDLVGFLGELKIKQMEKLWIMGMYSFLLKLNLIIIQR